MIGKWISQAPLRIVGLSSEGPIQLRAGKIRFWSCALLQAQFCSAEIQFCHETDVFPGFCFAPRKFSLTQNCRIIINFFAWVVAQRVDWLLSAALFKLWTVKAQTQFYPSFGISRNVIVSRKLHSKQIAARWLRWHYGAYTGSEPPAYT